LLAEFRRLYMPFILSGFMKQVSPENAKHAFSGGSAVIKRRDDFMKSILKEFEMSNLRPDDGYRLGVLMTMEVFNGNEDSMYGHEE
jgi:hypothetical protein